MTAQVEILADPSGLFAAEGMRIVAASNAPPGRYPVTIGITVRDPDGVERSYSVVQALTLSIEGFAFSEPYLADDGTGALLMPAAVLDFAGDRYFFNGGDA